MGIRPQKTPMPNSQVAQHVLEQMEVIFQDVRTNALQAFIKNEAHYEKKANASKLKERVYVYVL